MKSFMNNKVLPFGFIVVFIVRAMVLVKVNLNLLLFLKLLYDNSMENYVASN